MCVAPEFRATRRSFDHRSDPPRYAGSRSFDAAQPHILYRLSWLWVLLAGVGAYLLLLRTLLGTQNPNFLPSMILFGAMVVPATVLTFATTGGRRKSGSVPALWRSRRSRAASSVRSRLPHWSTTLCGHLGALPMLMVGLIEEASKIVVPTAVFLIDRRLRWPEVAVLGVASGAGFATLETMGYGFNALLSGGLGALDGTLLLRALLVPARHVAWTGLSMAAIGRIRGTSHRARAVFVAIGVSVAVVILHAVWDGSNNLIIRVLVAVLSFGALMLTLVAARRAEGRSYTG
jgi:protease PrsW